MPQISFHGTHVAGIAAGNAGNTSRRRAPITRRPPGCPASRRARGSATTACSTRRRPPATSRTRPRSSRRSRLRCRRNGRDQLLRRRPDGRPVDDPLIEAVANVARRAWFRWSQPGTTATTSASARSARPAWPRTRSPSPRCPTRTSSRRCCVTRRTRRVAADDPDGRALGVRRDAATDARRRDDDHGDERTPGRLQLCGLGIDPNDATRTLPAGRSPALSCSRRAACTFLSKAQRARGGAVGVIVVDNRFGEANAIPIELRPVGDDRGPGRREAARLHRASGGRTMIRVDQAPAEIVTGRSGVITSFSSAAPTNFGHA